MPTLASIAAALVITAVLVDWGRMSLCRQHLQGVADQAVLAGAKKLLGTLPPSERAWEVDDELFAYDAAHATAREVIAHGLAGESLRSTGDEENAAQVAVSVGSLAETQTQPYVQAWDGEALCDSVEVRLLRSAAAGNGLPLWVTGLFGKSMSDIRVVSRAKLARGIVGFRATAKQPIPALPFAVPATGETWGWYEQALPDKVSVFQDRYGISRGEGSVTPRGDGIPEVIVRLDIQSRTDSKNSFREGFAWVGDFGIASPDASIYDYILAGIPSGELRQGDPLPQAATARADDPRGRESSRPQSDHRALMQSLLAMVGQPRIIPLAASTGRGEGLSIRDFAAGAVVDCYWDDAQYLVVVIQPCMFHSETALVDDAAPANPWLGKVVLAD